MHLSVVAYNLLVLARLRLPKVGCADRKRRYWKGVTGVSVRPVGLELRRLRNIDTDLFSEQKAMPG